MNGLSRLMGAIAGAGGLYTALVIETAIGSPTILPHTPLALAVWGVFWLRANGAVLLGAITGLGCDFISAGPLGPAMVATTLVCFMAKQVQMRREIGSAIAIGITTAIMVSAILALSAGISGSVLQTRIDWRATGLIACSRGLTTAGIVVLIVLASRSLQVLRRAAAF